MKTEIDLQNLLKSIDHRGYPAYKECRGAYDFKDYILSIDHVQGDPFAAPSKLSIHIPVKTAGFPKNLWDLPYKRITLQDHLTRLFKAEVDRYQFKAKGSGKSGLISVSRCGEEVLERTACQITGGMLIMQVEVGFPANGRTINSRELSKVLFDFLPKAIRSSLYWKAIDKNKLEDSIKLCEDQEYIRESLPKLGLCAFIANGSILPRKSGICDRPMKDGIPLKSPASMEVTLDLPNRGKVSGMGIKRGITLFVGGGYHGKSTLLNALEMGVYNHIIGDGRELVITDSSALKLKAEDGRSIKNTDISSFISRLPSKSDTTHFYTEDASGSTSQAANLIEGVESGTSLFLIDEDTSATNFMIRDELMQQVICRDEEPITPLIERVQSLYKDWGISSILVAGSSGAYFHLADTIVQMKDYVPYDITDRAKSTARLYTAVHTSSCGPKPSFKRMPLPNPVFKKSDRIKMKVFGKDSFSILHDTVELRSVDQLADCEQTAALSYILLYAETHLMDGKKSMMDIADCIENLINEKGLSFLCRDGYIKSPMARPRRQEILCALNRYRGLMF